MKISDVAQELRRYKGDMETNVLGFKKTNGTLNIITGFTPEKKESKREKFLEKGVYTKAI